MDTDCFAWLAPGMNTTQGNTALAIINVVANSNSSPIVASPNLPSTTDWPDVNATHGPCVDLDPDSLTPLVSIDPDTNVLGRVRNQALDISLPPRVWNQHDGRKCVLIH